MQLTEKETGMVQVVADRLATLRLPRALDIKAKVDSGERLNEDDLAFLDEVLQDTMNVKGFLDQHVEYQDLAARIIHLYKEITDKALENEKAT